MTTPETIAAVAPLIGSKWGYQDEYRAFIGERCDQCGGRGDGNPCTLCRDEIKAGIPGRDDYQPEPKETP